LLFVPSLTVFQILHSAHRTYLCLLCGSQGKQQFFLYTFLNAWLHNQERVRFLRGRNCVFKYRSNSCIYLFTAKRFGSVGLVQCLPSVIYLNYKHVDVERERKYLGSVFLYLLFFLLNVTKINLRIEMSALKFIVRASTCSWLSFFCLYCKLFVTLRTTTSKILHSLVSWTCLKIHDLMGWACPWQYHNIDFFYVYGSVQR